MLAHSAGGDPQVSSCASALATGLPLTPSAPSLETIITPETGLHPTMLPPTASTPPSAPTSSGRGPFFHQGFVNKWGGIEVSYTGDTHPSTRLAHGHGTGVTSEKDKPGVSYVFVGTWVNGQMHGDQGHVHEYIEKPGSTNVEYDYKGQWKNGLPDGQGTETSYHEQYDCPSRHYIGQFRGGKPNGYGVAKFFFWGEFLLIDSLTNQTIFDKLVVLIRTTILGKGVQRQLERWPFSWRSWCTYLQKWDSLHWSMERGKKAWCKWTNSVGKR